MKAFESVLGNSNADAYFNYKSQSNPCTSKTRFDRGHLTPNADFVQPGQRVRIFFEIPYAECCFFKNFLACPICYLYFCYFHVRNS